MASLRCIKYLKFYNCEAEDGSLFETGIEVPCPPLLHDYNVGVVGVDFNDRQKSFITLRRSTH